MPSVTNFIPQWFRFQSPGETIYRYIDFTATLEPGDSIASVVSVVSAPSDLSTSAEVIGPNSAGLAAQIVQFTASGGTEASVGAAAYLITCTVVTALGETLIRSATLRIGAT